MLLQMLPSSPSSPISTQSPHPGLHHTVAVHGLCMHVCSLTFLLTFSFFLVLWLFWYYILKFCSLISRKCEVYRKTMIFFFCLYFYALILLFDFNSLSIFCHFHSWFQNSIFSYWFLFDKHSLLLRFRAKNKPGGHSKNLWVRKNKKRIHVNCVDRAQ